MNILATIDHACIVVHLLMAHASAARMETTNMVMVRTSASSVDRHPRAPVCGVLTANMKNKLIGREVAVR